MRRIEAVRRTGLTYRQSCDVAMRRIDPNAMYLISRHGAWFRSRAQGYTHDLADAGAFTGAEARSYICVDGLSVVPLADVVEQAKAQIANLERQAAALSALISISQ